MRTPTNKSNSELSALTEKQARGLRSVNRRFGGRVRELRIAANVLPMDLSFQIETTRGHLEDIEDGIESVDLEQIDRLAFAFRITIADMLAGI